MDTYTRAQRQRERGGGESNDEMGEKRTTYTTTPKRGVTDTKTDRRN